MNIYIILSILSLLSLLVEVCILQHTHMHIYMYIYIYVYTYTCICSLHDVSRATTHSEHQQCTHHTFHLEPTLTHILRHLPRPARERQHSLKPRNMPSKQRRKPNKSNNFVASPGDSVRPGTHSLDWD
ncbi:hypothetical protein BD289DRAFT_103522 [Coniella lustricola]|uniref:Secreted protein n=1 Tax=Coniella lustricola TaxID=2025994 RepID=A0A2T2ZY08_9PEZI|nr:hypothetical protein BD289DRAFT_103522 [Coniella lustricola]